MLEAESFVYELASRFRLAGTLIASAGHCWLRVARAFPSSAPPPARAARAFSRAMACKQEPQPPCPPLRAGAEISDDYLVIWRWLGRAGQRAPGGGAGRPGGRGGETQAGRHMREYPWFLALLLVPGSLLSSVPKPRFVSAAFCRNSLRSSLVRSTPTSTPAPRRQRSAFRFASPVRVRIPASIEEGSIKGLIRDPRS